MVRFVGILIACHLLAGCEQAAEKRMTDIYDQVAQDAVDQYLLTQKHGTAVDRCVHAGMVSAAFLQAKNEEQYRHWKIIENLDCANAGVT